MGLFERLRGKEPQGDQPSEPSKTQAELKEMMDAKSKIIDLAARLPEYFDSTIDIPEGVVAPEGSAGNVRVIKRKESLLGHNVDTGGTAKEEVPKTKITFPKSQYQEDKYLGTVKIDSAVLYWVDRDGLHGQDGELIADMNSQAAKDVTAILEQVTQQIE